MIILFGADQSFWAQRMKALRVEAEPLNPRQLSAKRLSGVIQWAVEDYQIRVNSMVLGKKIRGEDRLDEDSKKFESGEFFLPELLVASDAFKEGMQVLFQHLGQASLRQSGRVVPGTVEGDVQDIGKKPGRVFPEKRRS